MCYCRSYLPYSRFVPEWAMDELPLGSEQSRTSAANTENNAEAFIKKEETSGKILYSIVNGSFCLPVNVKIVL